MESYVLNSKSSIPELVYLVQNSSEPVSVYDEGFECLIAMRPDVFERLLFDSNLLNCARRESMHF